MLKRISFSNIFGFFFVGVLGVIFHFLYEWSGKSAVIAPFCAVNESIWEHTKLLFFPMLLWACVERFYMGKNSENFWCVKLFSILTGVILIPAFYYTINGAFGTTPDWGNIAIFFVSTAISFITEKKTEDFIRCNSPLSSIFTIFLIAVLFAIFTFYPPDFPIFTDFSI